MKKQLETPLNSEEKITGFHSNDEQQKDDEHKISTQLDDHENQTNQKQDIPKKDNNAEENYRLAGRTPLKTLLILSVGPLISQLVSAMYGVVASMWVAKAAGDIGMAAVSLFTNIDNIGRAFGFFMNCSASQKISSLFGEKKGDEAGQVVCDLFRCCIICGMIVPAILIPVAKPLGKWFGADDLTTQMACKYVYTLLGCSFVSCNFLMFCGVLQAEGRTTLLSIFQISSFIMNMFIFCPLFLLVLHLSTFGAALATVLSEAIPGIVLFILYFSGKFGVKPKLNGLFKKFSPHTWPALSVGVSQLAANCSRSLPSLLQRKFMGLICENAKTMSFNDAMAGFNAVIRIYGISDSVRLAISMALLPTASYSNSACLYNRFLLLCFHAGWLNIVWGVSSCLVTTFWPKYVAMIISNSEPFIEAAAPMLKISNMEAPYAWGRFLCQTILQALGFGGMATIYSLFATFFVNIGSYCLMYFTDKTNVPRMMWSYSCSSATAFVLGIICLIKPLMTVYRKYKATVKYNMHSSEKIAHSIDDQEELKSNEKIDYKEENSDDVNPNQKNVETV